MSRRDSRTAKKSSLLSRLLADPWRKLLALALAIGLWVFLDNQITKTVTLQCKLRAVDSQVITPPIEGQSVLDLRVPRREYTPVEFLDPADRPIEEIRLEFKGAAHEMRLIEPGEQFFVRAQPRKGEIIFEFDVTSVRGPRELIRGLVSMTPPRIKAVLEPNTSVSLTLSEQNVLIKTPEAVNGEVYDGRMERQSVRFVPETISLHGTERVLGNLDLRDLFTLDLTDPDLWTGSEISRKRLVLNEALVGAVEPSSTVRATIPLRPNYKILQLEVKVLLDLENTQFEPEDFDPIKPLAVTLRVSGKLESLLLFGMTAQEQQDWADRNLRVYAPLPETANRGQVPPILGRLLFVQQDFVEGTDYRVDMPPVTVTPRSN